MVPGKKFWVHHEVLGLSTTTKPLQKKEFVGSNQNHPQPSISGGVRSGKRHSRHDRHSRNQLVFHQDSEQGGGFGRLGRPLQQQNIPTLGEETVDPTRGKLCQNGSETQRKPQSKITGKVEVRDAGGWLPTTTPSHCQRQKKAGEDQGWLS